MAEPPKHKPESRKLTPEEKAKAIAWVEKFTKDGNGCPICRHPKWELSEEFVEIHPHYGRVVLSGGHVYPQIMLVCEQCAYAFLFNAITIGVMESQADGT
jgi:C4-type Zn-finger protein